MKSKIYFSLLLILIILPLASSLCELADADIGTFKQNQNVTLWQTCPDCTFVNISRVLYPNSTVALGQVVMTQQGTTYNYTFSLTNTIGNYIYQTFGNSTTNGLCTQNVRFTINQLGDTLTTQSGLVYIFMIAIAFVLFFISLYGATKVQWKDNYDYYSGSLVSVSGKKYMKIILLFVAYLILLFIFSMANDLSSSYLYLSGMNGLFKVGYFSLLVLAAPLFLGMCIFLLLTVLTDKKIQRAVSRGIPVRR